MFTIKQILTVSFQEALNVMKGGKPFVDDALNEAYEEGVVTLVPLGTVESKKLKIKELCVPLTWTKLDEVRADTEPKRISLAKALIENGIYCVDDLTLEKYPLDKFKLAISDTYTYELSDTYPITGQFAFYCFLYRALIAIKN